MSIALYYRYPARPDLGLRLRLDLPGGTLARLGLTADSIRRARFRPAFFPDAVVLHRDDAARPLESIQLTLLDNGEVSFELRSDRFSEVLDLAGHPSGDDVWGRSPTVLTIYESALRVTVPPPRERVRKRGVKKRTNGAAKVEPTPEPPTIVPAPAVAMITLPSGATLPLDEALQLGKLFQA